MALESSLHHLLRAAILNGQYHGGDVLVETAVAEAFGVSRTPVREAFGRLQQEGLLERHGRNLVIHKPTPQEVLEINDCVTVLETTAAQWAARERTDYDMALMRRALNEMKDHEESLPAEMAAMERAFHVNIWRASHNATLRDLLERLMVKIDRYPEPSISQPGRWIEAIEEHSLILEAIESRDEEAARDISMKHSAAARNLRLEMIARDTGYGTAARNHA